MIKGPEERIGSEEARERVVQHMFCRRWCELTEGEQSKAAYFHELTQDEEARKAAAAIAPEDRIDPRSGVTENQAMWLFEKIAKVVNEAINEQLPKVVAAHAKDAISKYLDEANIEKRIQVLENAERLNTNLSSAIDVRMRRCEDALTTESVSELKALIEKQAETIASLQRQASRHAEHLARIEDWKKSR